MTDPTSEKSEGKSGPAAFFKAEYTRLVNFVRTKIADTADLDPEDIVQEVAVNLFGRADITAPVENLSGFVYRSLRNEITDFFRTRKQTVSLDRPAGVDADITLADLLKDLSPGAGADARLERDERLEVLYGLLNELSDSERALVVATELEGYTFRQLAEKWQIPMNTLLSRKSRAMKKMKTKLIHKK